MPLKSSNYSGQPQGIAPTYHKGLPLHQNIFVSLHKNIVVGAILYGCPE
ncbi:MAG: hypothetical protein KAI83_10710 [Thiomargarita sp.]|nr:hypothetical protein [Thiomargarita sp.]